MLLIGTLIETEIELVLCAVLCGFKISLIAWTLAALRVIKRHNKILIAIEDFVFANVVGVYIFLVLYKYNDGIIRAFILIFVMLTCYICNITIYRVLKMVVKKAKIQVDKIINRFKGRNRVNGEKKEKRLE